MRLLFRLGDERYPVDLAREADGRWRITAAGTTFAAALEPGGTTEVLLDLDGRPLRAVVAHDGARWWVAAGGEVAVLDEVTDDDPRQGRAHAALEVVSPIPGRVVKVLVAQGDMVEPGQVVATVEAMKMENALRAEGAGRIARVLVAPGDRVEPGQRLVELASPA